jgi:diguanylate cyclase (GGDEF)-like protein
MRFCAGATLLNSEGDTFGTLCVIDESPRELNEAQANALWALSRQAVAQVELKNTVAELKSTTTRLFNYQSQLDEYQQRLELTNARLQTLSLTDDLTDLNNRVAFEEELRDTVQRTWKSGASLSLLLLGADHFKSYNEQFGHPLGDVALRTIAGYLKGSMRTIDFVARIAGDNFAIILPGTPRESASSIAQRCRRALELSAWHERVITVSIGIASMDGRNIDSGTLTSEAERALNHAKTTGRNCVTHASEVTGGILPAGAR